MASLDLFTKGSNYLGAFDVFLSLLHADPPKIHLYLIVAAVVLLLLLFRRRRKSPPRAQPQAHLEALSTVVVPLKNARGMALVPHTTRRKQNIVLPLTPLLDQIRSGDIELRSAVDDLADLFQDRLRVYGWNIVLDVESWRPRVICWLLKAQFYYKKPATSLPGKIQTALSHSFICHICATKDVPLLSQNPKTLHLNTIPHSQIHAAIQNHLIKRGRSTLEFTTLAPTVPWMSREFILASVPFLRRSGTPTPLLTSLIDILKVPNARIKTVENVSSQYAALLTTIELQLVEDRTTRTEFINKYGLQKWREHRFLLMWEAALLNAGLTLRWIVVFEKHEM